MSYYNIEYTSIQDSLQAILIHLFPHGRCQCTVRLLLQVQQHTRDGAYSVCSALSPCIGLMRYRCTGRCCSELSPCGPRVHSATYLTAVVDRSKSACHRHSALCAST